MRRYSVLGRPVILNSSYFIENIFFLDLNLKLLAQKGRNTNCLPFRFQDTNGLLKNISSLLTDDLILCTTDVVALYPNVPHEEGVIVIREALDATKDKTMSTDSLIELPECVLKSNIF